MIRRPLAFTSLTLLLAAAIVVAVTAACASKHDDVGTVTPTAAPTSSSPAGASSTPSGGDAFVIYRDDQGNLVARNFQTSQSYKQTVDYNQEVIIQATCSPDGSRIGYMIQNFSEDFRRLQIHGTGAPAGYIQVSSNVQGFAWSPDGTKLATAAWDHQTSHATISLVDVATGDTAEIWSGGQLAVGLNWSPDGRELTYASQDLAAGKSKIDLLNVNGGQPRDLILQTDQQWLDPVWAPDGNSIVATGLSSTAAQLFRIDVATSQATQLTQDTSIFRRSPQFSPDGNVIGFTGSIVVPQVSAIASKLQHSFGIFTIKPDGSEEKPLTVDPRTSAGANVDPYLNAYLLGWCKPGPWLDDAWAQEEAAQ